MTPKRIQAIRARKKLSQSGFAKLLGVPVRTLQDWEQGRHAPSLLVMEAIENLAQTGVKGNQIGGNMHTPAAVVTILERYDEDLRDRSTEVKRVGLDTIQSLLQLFDVEVMYQRLKRKHPDARIEFLEGGKTYTKEDIGALKKARVLLRAARKRLKD